MSRCFRKEFRRVILAFATRTASVLVVSCFSCGVFATFPTVGIIGSTCVGIIEARSIGCVLIGPVVNLFLSIVANSFLPYLFKAKQNRASTRPDQIPARDTAAFCRAAETSLEREKLSEKRNFFPRRTNGIRREMRKPCSLGGGQANAARELAGCHSRAPKRHQGRRRRPDMRQFSPSAPRVPSQSAKSRRTAC